MMDQTRNIFLAYVLVVVLMGQGQFCLVLLSMSGFIQSVTQILRHLVSQSSCNHSLKHQRALLILCLHFEEKRILINNYSYNFGDLAMANLSAHISVSGDWSYILKLIIVS